MTADTSKEAVGRLAEDVMKPDYLSPTRHTVAATLRALAAERDALKAFKAYTHDRLDGAGIPTHPEGRHSAEGCRVGDRFDLLIADRDAARAEVARLRTLLARAQEELRLINMKDTGALYDIGLRVEMVAALAQPADPHAVAREVAQRRAGVCAALAQKEGGE